MDTSAARLRSQMWRRGDYLISTNSSLIPVETVQGLFASEDFYWSGSLPKQAMKETLENSLCFGLYKATQASASDAEVAQHSDLLGEFTGIARCITDFTTFMYLTDVWVNPSEQGKGLGTWLITCVQDTINQMPHLRRCVLFTGNWERSVPFYRELLDAEVLECRPGHGIAIMSAKGRGHPSRAGEGKQ